MSITKHKLFKVPLTEKGPDYIIDDTAQKAINDFLSEANYVYVNHSITALGKDTSASGNAYRERYLIISLVYKDLNESPNQLKNVTGKTKQIVTKSIEKGDDLVMPDYKTTFDSKIEANQVKTP